jgi:hypothetical protein
MKYTKPEVVVLDKAISVVQLSKSVGLYDSQYPCSMVHTPSPYQADEWRISSSLFTGSPATLRS